MSIRLLLADDHALFRRGVRRILDEQPDMQVVGEAENGLQAVELAESLRPDVVLLDVRMPELDGVAACREIQSRCPDARMLILTVSDEDEDLFGAIKAGARGYLLKNVGEQELLDAVRRVAAGEAVISPALAGRVLDELAGRTGGAQPSPQALTGREQEILSLAATGLTNQEIAERLHLSVHTVKTHLRHVLDKLHARNRAEAAALAARRGLVRRPPAGPERAGEGGPGQMSLPGAGHLS